MLIQNRKIDKNCIKTLKIRKFHKLLHFWGHSGVNQKIPKISTNTYPTEPNLCKLNSIGDIFQFEYKFGA